MVVVLILLRFEIGCVILLVSIKEFAFGFAILN